MNECKYIKDFIKDNNLNNLENIYNCECKYCNCKSLFDNFNKEIKKIDTNDNINYNHMNLIWTKPMIFIKKYLYIFENNINLIFK